MSFEKINRLRGDFATERFNKLPGQTFGNVTVVGFADNNKSNVKRVVVQCRCGLTYPITAIYLRKREVTQCQSCSQILRYRGKEGYEKYLESK